MDLTDKNKAEETNDSALEDNQGVNKIDEEKAAVVKTVNKIEETKSC